MARTRSQIHEGKKIALRYRAGGINHMGHVGPKSDPTGLWFNKCRGPLNVNGNGVKFEDPSCPSSGTWLSNGPIQRLSLNVRGGTQGGTTYYVGGNWDDEKGTLPRSGLHNRGLRVNLGFVPATHFNLAINSSIAQNFSQGFADGNSAGGAALNISRRLPAPIDQCGKVFWGTPVHENEAQIPVRLDYQASQKHSIIVRYMLTTDDRQMINASRRSSISRRWPVVGAGSGLFDRTGQPRPIISFWPGCAQSTSSPATCAPPSP